MSKVDFPALTGMRAIAAYMVFIHHNNFFSVDVFGKTINSFFSEFHIGVTLFFVLSGFLIANRYYEEDNFNFKSYITKRFARIYPMYFILTSVTFLAGIFFMQYQGSLQLYFLNITFLRGFFDDLKFSGVAQGWSLTVEEMFYVLAPLCFIAIKRSRWMLLVLPFCFILLGAFLVWVFQHIDFHGLMSNNNFMFVYTFFGRACEFFVGIALALVIKREKVIKIKNITIYAVISIVLWIYLLSIFRVGEHSGIETIHGKIINTFFLPLFGIAPLFYALVKEETFLSKVLSTKVFLLLGKSSYVFYLVHMGIFKSGFSKITTNTIFLFIILNILAMILYLLIEKPLNDFIRKTYLRN